MTQTTEQIANGSRLDRWGMDDEGCPVHGTPLKREYEFGSVGYRPDASVSVFSGCSCAVCEVPNCFGDVKQTYFDNYSQAAGAARFVKSSEVSFQRKYF